MLAIKLFEMKRVSVGRAAEIAGMGKIAFMDELGRARVPVIDFTRISSSTSSAMSERPIVVALPRCGVYGSQRLIEAVLRDVGE